MKLEECANHLRFDCNKAERKCNICNGSVVKMNLNGMTVLRSCRQNYRLFRLGKVKELALQLLQTLIWIKKIQMLIQSISEDPSQSILAWVSKLGRTWNLMTVILWCHSGHLGLPCLRWGQQCVVNSISKKSSIMLMTALNLCSLLWAMEILPWCTGQVLLAISKLN